MRMLKNLFEVRACVRACMRAVTRALVYVCVCVVKGAVEKPAGGQKSSAQGRARRDVFADQGYFPFSALEMRWIINI